MRALIRGSSISSGVEVKKSYVSIAQEMLSSLNVTLFNRSSPRETSFDAVRTYDSDISPFSPDLLVLHFGIEDAYSSIFRSEFKENLVQIVRLARKDMIKNIALMTSHTFDNEYEMQTIEIYYRTIREVALDLHCHFLPLHFFWIGFIVENEQKNDNLLLQDCRLPNDKGHEIYARVLIDFINKIKELYYEYNN